MIYKSMGQQKYIFWLLLNLKKIYKILLRERGRLMSITVNADINKEVLNNITVTKLMEDESYKLCVKADALRLANMFQESVSKYLRSILINRENIDAYYGLAMSYKNLNNYQKAIDTLDKAIAIKDDDFSLFYELGVCYLLSGKPCCALKFLIRSIQLNPDNLNAQIQLALAHELVGEEELALMIYQRIIEVAPDFIKAYKHKAALLMSLEMYKDACVVFNTILKINPSYIKALLGMGICFEKLQKTVNAIRYYKKFLSREPKSLQVEYVKGRLNILKRNKVCKKQLALVTNTVNV